MRHLGILLVLVACGRGSEPSRTGSASGSAPAAPPAGSATPAGSAMTAKPAPPPPPPAPAPAPSVKLEELQAGDRACYVVVTRAGGEQASIEGDFELCKGGGKDATGLIGKQVTYRTEKAKIAAASCQGDPECTKSDEVDLIVELTAVP